MHTLFALFIFVFVNLLDCLQHNYKTTVWIVLTFLENIGTVTRKNQLKLVHDRVNILVSGTIFFSYVTIENNEIIYFNSFKRISDFPTESYKQRREEVFICSGKNCIFLCIYYIFSDTNSRVGSDSYID